MSLNTFKLSQVFRMGRVRPAEHIQFAIELGYPFVIDPEITRVSTYITREKNSDQGSLLVTERRKFFLQRR